MNSTIIKSKIFYIAFISIISIFFIGCGSSVENPASSPEEETKEDNEQIPNDSEMTSDSELAVDVKVSKNSVSPGDTVELAAIVEKVKSNRLIFKWVNVTGYGILSNTDQTSTVWTAPSNLESGEVKVEVIHLVVTAISQIISVNGSKVNTDTEIYTGTKTVPLTVID